MDVDKTIFGNMPRKTISSNKRIFIDEHIIAIKSFLRLMQYGIPAIARTFTTGIAKRVGLLLKRSTMNGV